MRKYINYLIFNKKFILYINMMINGQINIFYEINIMDYLKYILSELYP